MALFVLAAGDAGFAAAAEPAARAQFARHGLPDPAVCDVPGWRVLHSRPIAGGPDTLLVRGDDLVAVAGTPVVDGLIGRAALERLLDADLLPHPDWTRIGGHFTALVRRGGRTWLLGDHLGVFQCYHDAGERFFSTSLLAALEVMERVSFDTQALYEWCLGVVTVGNDTVFRELKFLGPERIVELLPDGRTASVATRKPLTREVDRDLPMAERVARNRATFERIIAAQVRAFGDNINCPLSAGMDSRLVLAALRAAGARPNVYVYGPPGGADVEIALAVGKALGFPVEWIDKQAEAIAPDAWVEQVERNYQEWDGLPNFGNIFDNGANSRARDKRHANGALAISGGGGEVFRDYFMLPDRPQSALTLTRCFNSRFAPSDATDLFEPAAYVRRIADKVAADLGTTRDEKLPRNLIEQAFPRTRLRALFRWEVNLESRWSPYCMAFLDPVLIDEANRVPMALRQAGAFEARLIEAFDPDLARQMSGYGHHFAGPPGWRYRLDEWSTRARPVWLRERMYRLKRKRGAMVDEHGGILSAEYLGRVIDLEFPVMRRFFHVDRVADSGLKRRIACMEHLAQKLGGKLAA